MPNDAGARVAVDGPADMQGETSMGWTRNYDAGVVEAPNSWRATMIKAILNGVGFALTFCGSIWLYCLQRSSSRVVSGGTFGDPIAEATSEKRRARESCVQHIAIGMTLLGGCMMFGADFLD